MAGFRLLHGANPDDPCIRQVIGERKDNSGDFVNLWPATPSGERPEDQDAHPDVGELTLRMLAFDVRSSPGQQLVV